MADAYCRHAAHPAVRLSATFSNITGFALLEYTLNFTSRLIITEA